MAPPRRPAARPPLAAIVGPTAAGKTELSLAVAQRLPVEVLVADSRQVYRGMEVGTAKPTAAERAAVQHHLLDLVEPDEPFTLADWQAAARVAASEASARGRIPLLVGGSGLHVAALVDGYDLASQPWSPELRRMLVDELETDGLATLAGRLARVDPVAAARTDLRNPRRVLRALERAMAAGGGASRAPGARPWPGRVGLVGISRPRDVLRARIAARTRAMFDAGLLEEVRRLRSADFGTELPAMSGHGYREAALVLDGEWTREQAIEITARHTAQYAKRQMTWFRRDRRIVWLDAGDGPADVPELVERAVALLRRLTD